MKFVSTRDLRNRPGFVRALAKKEDLVLTAHGKPVALLLGIDEDELDETTQLVRQARAKRALSRIRQDIASRGAERSLLSVVDREIRAVRSKRKSH
jgi:antitoxin (DNA-binding transcriptional repressor) of toxin-antitoxin stability system